MSQSAVQFATERRIHMSLGVSNVEASKAFYQEVFGVPPTKTRPGYARFELHEPPLNLSVIETEGNTGPSDGTSHFGVQVKSIDAVEMMRKRYESAGLATTTEDTVNCCHAIQDKVWVVDPDGHRWEVFVVLDDQPENAGQSTSACCVPALEETCCSVESETCCTENQSA